MIEKKHPGTGDPVLDLIYGCTSAGLVLFAGLMSGLTLGLMSLDVVELEVLRRSGTERQKHYAERIIPVCCGYCYQYVAVHIPNNPPYNPPNTSPPHTPP